MVISELNLLPYFFVLNEEYFGGILPIPTLRIKHSYRTLGYFHCNVDDEGYPFNEVIEISDNYDYTESQLTEVMLHEMIHYYLMYMGIDCECTHGKEFRKMCNEFNSKYGFSLSKYIDLSNYKIREGKSNFMFKLCTLF